MRFGRTLQLATYEPWKDNYIDYAKLKKLLREDDPSDSTTPEQWTDEDEREFVDELVNVQLEKVHKFHRDTHEKLRERTAQCEAKLDDIAVSSANTEEKGGPQTNGNDGGKKAVPSEDTNRTTLKEVLGELDQITKETSELEKYSRINYTGFLKAAKKHDRKRGASYRVRPLLQVRLAALPFNKEDYGPLLFRLSAMYSFARQQLDGSDADKSAEAQEGTEEYVSHKFWVHPENLLEVKTMILRHLPVLVYNPQTSKVAQGSQPDPSITSIYLDNPALKLYSDRVDRNAGSSLRLRWYGQLNDKPEIWVEKKTVKEDGASNVSRFTMKDKYVQRFLSGDYHMEKQIQKLAERAGSESVEAKQLRESVGEISSFIKENDLQSVVRANYSRTAFQVPGEDRVRISLDTDLAFIREDAIDTERPCRDPETWHRTDIDNNEMEYPFSSIRKGEVSRFPFAVLEIKVHTENGKKPAEWVEDIMNSHLVKPAPKFSKFVHGVAQLFEDYVNTFPFWLSEMETDIRRDPHQAFEDEQAKKQKEAEDAFAVGSLLRSKPGASPMSKPKSDVMVSPVGSPSVADNFKKSPASKGHGRSDLGNAVSADQTQLENVVEEPDEDETGHQAHGAERSTTPGGLKTLFPTFSTSKYAMSRRTPKNQLPPGVEEPKFWIKDQGPLKVEAKVWLANQRTFIKWQHVSVLLASLSLGLYNAAGEDNNIARALAIVYTLVAVFAAAWGYGIYMWRTNLIERRSGKDFDAVTGPIVVCVGLIVALMLNFAFKYHAVMANNDPADASSAALHVVNQTAMLLPHRGDL